MTVTDSQRYENTLSNKTHEWNPINYNTSSECHAPTAQRKLHPCAVRPSDHSIFPSAQSRLPHPSAERRAPSAHFFRASRFPGGSFQLGFLGSLSVFDRKTRRVKKKTSEKSCFFPIFSKNDQNLTDLKKFLFTFFLQ